MTYKETPDYTEEIVGFVIESFLAAASFPDFRFSIEPFSRAQERLNGADGRLIDNVQFFKPFYMQFKRPFAYLEDSSSQIVKDRAKLGLMTSPKSLFFKLQDKQPKHTDYQHNLLFKLREDLRGRNEGDAAYVCPLFLHREAYRQTLHLSALQQWRRLPPWMLEDIYIHRRGRGLSFLEIPTLREHVSIPPHALVTDAKHRYSFTEYGTEICFHSPKVIEEGSRPLNKWLEPMYRNFKEKEGVISPDFAAIRLEILIEAVDLEKRDELSSEHGIRGWLLLGDYLKREYQIEQYAFIRWRE